MRLCIGLLIAVSASAAEMTGYISDAACGWNNARPGKEAKECAQKCVKAGWDPVFILNGKADAIKIREKARRCPSWASMSRLTASWSTAC